MNELNDNLTKDEHLEALKEIVANKDKDLLHTWIELNFHVNIPRVAICPDHCAPFDFVADYIFGYIDFGIVVANRSGGKTLNFGILDTLMSYYQSNTEIATVGAIQFQAQRGYEYFNQFSSNNPFASNVDSMTISKTLLKNGSKVQILTGTMSGVNSPHPQLVFLDEIDLMVWQVLQQALSMAQSKGGVKSRTILTSTRKFTNGPMQRMIDEAGQRHAKVYMWCIWEVIEALPKNNPQLLKLIHNTFGTALPSGLEKKIYADTAKEDEETGKVGYSQSGYYSWEDVVTKYNTLDSEVWETEWICKRPGLEGVIYGQAYSDDNNLISDWINDTGEVISWTPLGKRGYLYLFEDYGYGEGHPDVVLFCYVPPEMDRIVIFDELYMTKQGTDEIWDMIGEKLREYDYVMPNPSLAIQGSMRGWIGDPHGLTEERDRKMKGAPMLPKVEDPKLYLVKNGIPIVRKFIQSGRLMITPKCINLRTELLSYKKAKKADGSYTDIPEKKNDHGPDALRYGLIKLFPTLAQKAFMPDTTEEELIPVTEELASQQQAAYPYPSVRSEPDTIVGNMMDNKDWR